MEAYLQDWLSLLLRWAHFITGVAWIGASFYFNWLENHLERRHSDGGIAGDLWAVHGGGFYYLQKYQVAPESLPDKLHWFKWEAYFTWITGFLLLCTVYYWNAGVFMVDSRVAELSSLQAVLIGLASLVLSWLFYDGLCRSPVVRKQALTALLIFAWFALISWLLSQYLSGRAAFIHVGAAIGTIMVANVFFVIIPSQKDLVDAVKEQRKPDAQKGKNALERSRHNNYFTLPVLFIMISNHYAGIFAHSANWVLLLVISVAGVGIRHWFNIRHLDKHSRLVLPLALLILAALIFVLRPQTEPGPDSPDKQDFPSTAEVMPVFQARCVTCHADKPDHAGFAAAPLGVLLELEESVDLQDMIIFNAVVVKQSMPLANTTNMSDEERELIARWYAGRMQRQRTR
jgi:uncharacterized membrane protein